MPTTEAVDGRRPLTPEVSLSEEISAWSQKREDLERARLQLFIDGEAALAKGLVQLGQKAKGTQITEDNFRRGLYVRQPLVIPDNPENLPFELRSLLSEIHMLPNSSRHPARFWADISTNNHDYLRIGASGGQESFELRMDYLKEGSSERGYRRVNIVRFSGFYTGRFERRVDAIKDLNASADANAKLTVALGMVKLVADLRK